MARRIISVNGTKVEEILSDSNLTLAEIGAKADLSKNTIYRILAGEMVRPKTVHKLCEGLGIKPRDIIVEIKKIG
ncbi:MAG: helix-turn-helix transcriptional regulator [Anaerostipes sp.]|nr:helix-turn-helix transcriptional regulator [Anaerostipes sp.]